MTSRDYLSPIPVLRRLRRCPFCGDNVNMVPMYDSNMETHMMILCMNKDCGAVVQFNDADAEEMVNRWNHDINRSLTNE